MAALLCRSYKERYRATATGKIRYFKPGDWQWSKVFCNQRSVYMQTRAHVHHALCAGHRHKRWVKGPRRNRRLAGENILHDAYARVMRKMGFT
jgi:ribosomal protein L35